MKIIKILPILLVLSLSSTIAFSADKKNCDSIEANTGVKMVEKWKCINAISSEKGLGKKLKKFFKKKD